jgi:hypothetical protein
MNAWLEYSLEGADTYIGYDIGSSRYSHPIHRGIEFQQASSDVKFE